jgi:hypothetical protein
VPWRGDFASACTLGGNVKFVLGASGHIAGTINPASKSKEERMAQRNALVMGGMVGAWDRMMRPLIDPMQFAIDRQLLASEVHLLLRIRR